MSSGCKVQDLAAKELQVIGVWGAVRGGVWGGSACWVLREGAGEGGGVVGMGEADEARW